MNHAKILKAGVFLVLLVAIEWGVQWWRRGAVEPSRDPLYSWHGAKLVKEADPPFGWALDVYRADRGCELKRQSPDAPALHVFYFEWDDVLAGPTISAGGHEAEVCNTAAGFKLIEVRGLRRHEFDSGDSLEFVITKFQSPDSRPVWVFKSSWIQGYGTWDQGQANDRLLRLKRSFLRLRGAGRVLQAGVFNVDAEDDAWKIFETEVLSQVTWVHPKEKG